MPAIHPNPTMNEDNIGKLPKILNEDQAKLDDQGIKRIRVRLNFADHKDLMHLNAIRVVPPDTIKMPSKESTTGCYYPESKSGRAEIWLSSDIVKAPEGFGAFLSRITYNDMLFRTLFHEIGHHKARLTHSVDKFEDEAYAEKYMLAYKKLWNKHYGPPKIYNVLLKILFKGIGYIFACILYFFRNKNEIFNLLYRHLKGEIAFKEIEDRITKSTNVDEKRTGVRKKKWTHPLTRKKYRNRFRLPER